MRTHRKVVGATAKQRSWVLARDNGRCQFRIYNNGRWTPCTMKYKALHVHHIVPRGWYAYHFGFNKAWDDPHNVNGPFNLITLCDLHHVGYNQPIGYEHCVHPDNIIALQSYRKGDKDAYKKMLEKRKVLTEKGIPYWITGWDWAFKRIVDNITPAFLYKHPFPNNRNCGTQGVPK